MTFGAPKSSYDPSVGTMLLNNIGPVPVSHATRNLLNRGVLAKMAKNAPGRTLKIAEAYAPFFVLLTSHCQHFFQKP